MTIDPELRTLFSQQQKSIDGLTELVRLLVCHLVKSPPAASSSLDLKAAMASVLSQKDTLDGKATRAVLVNVPEGENEEDTVSKDKAMLLRIFQEIDNPDLTKLLSEEKVTFFRHPKVRRDGSSHPRIIKIQLDSAASRTLFLAEAIRVKCGRLTGSTRAYIRPDYTMDQLSLERKLKREAYERNLEVGQIRFVVRNLEIVQLRECRNLPEGMQAEMHKRASREGSESVPSLFSTLSHFSHSLGANPFFADRSQGSSRSRGRSSNRGGRGRGNSSLSSLSRGGTQSRTRTRTRPSSGGMPGEPAAKAPHVATLSPSVEHPTPSDSPIVSSSPTHNEGHTLTLG